MNKRFNIRVYGIWLHDNKVLVNEELILGEKVIKFPGGGLDWGEGIADCLKREWKEELDMEIDITGHFYTTDFFQPSAFDDSQVISIYYRISAPFQPIIVNHVPNERAYWMDTKDISENAFTLPIDRKVGGMLQQLFNGGVSNF